MNKRINKPYAIDVVRILSKTLELTKCNTAVRHLCVIWPEADDMCLSLCEYILDITPSDQFNISLIEECMLEAKLIINQSLSKWRKHQITDKDVLTSFVLTLIQTATSIENWVICSDIDNTDIWDPSKGESLFIWWSTRNTGISINHKKDDIARGHVKETLTRIFLKDLDGVTLGDVHHA